MRQVPPLSLFSRGGTCRPRQVAFSLTVSKCWSCWPRQGSWSLPLLDPSLPNPIDIPPAAPRLLGASCCHRRAGTLSSMAAPRGQCGTPGTVAGEEGGVGQPRGKWGPRPAHCFPTKLWALVLGCARLEETAVLKALCHGRAPDFPINLQLKTRDAEPL